MRPPSRCPERCFHRRVTALVVPALVGPAAAIAASATTAPEATVSVIVQTADGLSTTAQHAVIAAHGGTETNAIPALRMHVVDVPTQDLDAVVGAYRDDPEVAGVSLDRERGATGAATDPSSPDQWALPNGGRGFLARAQDVARTLGGG